MDTILYRILEGREILDMKFLDNREDLSFLIANGLINRSGASPRTLCP